MCVLSDIVFVFAVSFVYVCVMYVCVCLEIMCLFFIVGINYKSLDHQGLSCESFLKPEKKVPAFVKEFRSVLLLSFAKCFLA